MGCGVRGGNPFRNKSLTLLIFNIPYLINIAKSK